METSSPRTRILLLSSSTGSGHDKRAEAFRQWIEKLYGDKIDLRTEQVIENGSTLGAFGVWLYNFIQGRAPALHHIYWHIVEFLTKSHNASVSYGGKYYRRYIAEFRPHLILSLHDSTNRGYFEDARRVLSPQEVTCYTYCGEWSGGFGFSDNWINFSADRLYVRTPETARYVLEKGFPKDKLKVFHKVLPPSAWAPRLSQEEIARKKQDWGLQENRLTLFLATGGYGANHHLRFICALDGLEKEVQLIVVCGRNQGVFNKLSVWKREHPEWICHLEGYSEEMASAYQLADMVVTRGGANSTTEALHYRCPPLYDTLGGVMPQEYCTIRYLEKHNAAVRLKSPLDLRRALELYRSNPDLLSKLRNDLGAMDVEESAQFWVEEIVQEAERIAKAEG